VPLTLVFLSIGMLAGSEGLGNIEFADYQQAFALGTVALAFILFDGGRTPTGRLSPGAWPGALLATWKSSRQPR
jgi:cell volume regulation protein A